MKLRCPNKAKGWFSRSGPSAGSQWLANQAVTVVCADAAPPKPRTTKRTTTESTRPPRTTRKWNLGKNKPQTTQTTTSTEKPEVKASLLESVPKVQLKLNFDDLTEFEKAMLEYLEEDKAKEEEAAASASVTVEILLKFESLCLNPKNASYESPQLSHS